MSGMWLRLPGDVSFRTFELIVDVVHRTPKGKRRAFPTERAALFESNRGYLKEWLSIGPLLAPAQYLVRPILIAASYAQSHPTRSHTGKDRLLPSIRDSRWL
jgi:hypothetical protein